MGEAFRFEVEPQLITDRKKSPPLILTQDWQIHKGRAWGAEMAGGRLRSCSSAFFFFYHGAALTLSLSMASSPPGVDMMRSWMLVTDWRPGWLHSEPDDGEAVREPIGAVEKLPGRWFSDATKYLFLLFCMSLRSEPTAGEKKRQGGRWQRTRGWRRKPGRGQTKHMKWKNKHKKKEWGLSREDRKRW